MYAREIDGRTLEFGVSGKLYRNGLIMYDRQTGSEWSHVTGQAIWGPLAGSQLQAIPAIQTTWAQWQRLHPESPVLSKRHSPYGLSAYRTDTYSSYYNSSRAGILGRAERDDRLGAKEYVLGLHIQGRAKAYAFQYLKKSPILNDTVAGTPVLVFSQPLRAEALQLELDNVTGVVYSRAVGEQVLTFRLAPGSTERRPLLLDAETGTVWRAFTGEAIQGPLAGHTLAQLPATNAFWFGWRDYFPETELFQPE